MLRPCRSVPHMFNSAQTCLGRAMGGEAEFQLDAVQRCGVPAAAQEGRVRALAPQQVLQAPVTMRGYTLHPSQNIFLGDT